MRELPFPKSFPNEIELRFLKLLLCDDKDFLTIYETWKKDVVMDQMDYATSRLLPLLSMRLQKFECKDEQALKIHGVYKLAWVKNQRLIDAMSKVVPLLEAQNVDVFVLKGIPLLLNVYKDVGARFLGDADLLVHPRHIKNVLTTMREAGWKLSSPHFPTEPYFSEVQINRIIKEATFVNDQRNEIDIHWRLFDVSKKETLPFDELWKRSVAIHFKENAYRTLSSEDMLLHVIVHGSEGNVHRTLRWVADAVAIIKTFMIDWDKFLEQTMRSEWRVDIQMAFSFLLHHKFVTLPESVSQSIAEMPLTESEIKKYYKKANTPHATFGGFPRLWNVYWSYEAKGIFPFNLYYFVEFLAHAWGLERKRELVPFIIKKYRQRISYSSPLGRRG